MANSRDYLNKAYYTIDPYVKDEQDDYIQQLRKYLRQYKDEQRRAWDPTPQHDDTSGSLLDPNENLARVSVTATGTIKEPEKPSVPLPAEIVEGLSQYVIGHDEAKKALAIAAYYHFHRIHKSTAAFRKSNVCLIGPTGTGKTLLLSTLAEVLNVPFVTVDATELTPDGYVGRDVGSFVNDITAKNGQKAEHAIVFIDEADKLSQQNGTASFKTAEIQKALLKLVEGKVTSDALRRNGGGMFGGGKQLDTTKMLFVIGGAFSGITHQANFGGRGSVTSEDLVRYGLMPEFVGRFPVITTLDPLHADDLVRILTAPKGNVVEEFTTIFREHGVELSFSDGALDVIARVALGMKTGARALRGVVERVLFQDLFDLPSRKDSKGPLVVTADVVRERLKVPEAFSAQVAKAVGVTVN